jgi:hypothetical protein
MSIHEIESEVDRLSPAEQEQLLRHIEATLRARRPQPGHPSREEWLKNLDQLRNSIGTGVNNLSVEQILAESREE